MLSNDNDNQNDLLQNLTRRSAVDPVKINKNESMLVWVLVVVGLQSLWKIVC